MDMKSIFIPDMTGKRMKGLDTIENNYSKLEQDKPQRSLQRPTSSLSRDRMHLRRSQGTIQKEIFGQITRGKSSSRMKLRIS